MILHLAVLIQCRFVTVDGQTHDDSTYRASIASHSKKIEKGQLYFWKLMSGYFGSVLHVAWLIDHTDYYA